MGFNELHCSLSTGGIPLLILATQETQCVGKSGGISPVNKKHVKVELDGPAVRALGVRSRKLSNVRKCQTPDR
jgi:hypothetical protein